ncbi:unnamed protein product, partial [Prorocentrum cordatum]
GPLAAAPANVLRARRACPAACGHDICPCSGEDIVVCDDDEDPSCPATKSSPVICGVQPTGVLVTPDRSIQWAPPAPERPSDWAPAATWPRPSNWAPPAPERPPAELPPLTARLGEPEGECSPMTARGRHGRRAEAAAAPAAPRTMLETLTPRLARRLPGGRRGIGAGAVAQVCATGGGDSDPWALPDVPLETLVAIDGDLPDDEVSLSTSRRVMEGTITRL